MLESIASRPRKYLTNFTCCWLRVFFNYLPLTTVIAPHKFKLIPWLSAYFGQGVSERPGMATQLVAHKAMLRLLLVSEQVIVECISTSIVGLNKGQDSCAYIGLGIVSQGVHVWLIKRVGHQYRLQVLRPLAAMELVPVSRPALRCHQPYCSITG